MSITITHDDRVSGLSLTAKVLSGATVSASQSMTEQTITGVLGRYSATISSLADGDYTAVVVDASGKVYGGGELRVKGNAEVAPAADIQYVRGQSLKGDGSEANPWNPA